MRSMGWLVRGCLITHALRKLLVSGRARDCSASAWKAASVSSVMSRTRPLWVTAMGDWDSRAEGEEPAEEGWKRASVKPSVSVGALRRTARERADRVGLNACGWGWGRAAEGQSERVARRLDWVCCAEAMLLCLNQAS